MEHIGVKEFDPATPERKIAAPGKEEMAKRRLTLYDRFALSVVAESCCQRLDLAWDHVINESSGA